MDVKKEMCDIHSQITVRASSPNGVILHGKLPHDNDAIIFIKSLQNAPFVSNGKCFWWMENFRFYSMPTILNEKENVEWYLIYFILSGYVGIRRRSDLENEDYLLAEMFCETNVVSPSNDRKIEIV